MCQSRPPAPPDFNVGDPGWGYTQTRIGRLFCNGIRLPLIPLGYNIEVGGKGGNIASDADAAGVYFSNTGTHIARQRPKQFNDNHHIDHDEKEAGATGRRKKKADQEMEMLRARPTVSTAASM